MAVPLNLSEEFNRRLSKSSQSNEGEAEMRISRRLSRKELFALQASKSSEEFRSLEENSDAPRRNFSSQALKGFSKMLRDSPSNKDKDNEKEAPKCRLPCQVIKSIGKRILSDSHKQPSFQNVGETTTVPSKSLSAKKSKSFSAPSDTLLGGNIGKSPSRSSFHGLHIRGRSKSAGTESVLRRAGKTLRSPSKLRASMVQQEEDHELFFGMISLNPNDPQERQHFQNLEEEIKTYIRKHPDALKLKYDFPVVGGRGKLTVSRYPLSAMVGLGASLSLLKMAIKGNPTALEGEGFGSTVLHTACSFDTDLQVLEYIYNKYPHAIQEATKLVYLPLHNACARKEPSLEMIQFLVGHYPEALLAINKLGDTPLRCAERNKTVSPEVLQYLQSKTHQVASLEENQQQWKEVDARQSWGSDELKGLINAPLAANV